MRRSVAWAVALVAACAWGRAPVVHAQDGVLKLVDQTAGVSYAVASQDPSLIAVGAGRRAHLVEVAPDGRTKVVGRTPIMPAIVRWMLLDGTRLYVAPEIKDIYVYDIADPAHPTEVGILRTSHEVREIAIRDGLLLTAEFGEGLVIYDVSKGLPDKPLTDEHTRRGIVGFAIEGDLLYAAYATEGLGIIDISNPREPRFLGRAKLPRGKGQGIAVAGKTVYISAESAMGIYDVSDPAAPTLLGSIENLATLRWVVTDGNALYLGAGIGGVVVYDITDPHAPKQVTTLPTPNEIVRLRRVGDRLYTIDWLSGITIYDVSAPLAPKKVGQVEELTGYARGIAAADDVVYAGYAHNRLDALDGTTLERITSVPLNKEAQDQYISIAGDRMAIGEYETGLWWFDIADRRAPRLLSHVEAPVRDVLLLDPRRIITTGGRMGMMFWDAADGADPRRTARTGTSSYMWGLDADDAHVYIANREVGVDVYSTTPEGAWPVEGKVDFRPISGSALDVAILDKDTLVAAGEGAGLVVIDIKDRAKPTIIGQANLQFRPIVLGIHNDIVVTGGRSNGIAVFDVHDRTHPRYVGFQPLTWAANSFAWQGDRVLVAGSGEGVLAYEIGTIPPVGTEVKESGTVGLEPQPSQPTESAALSDDTSAPTPPVPSALRNWRLWVAVLGGFALAVAVALAGRAALNRVRARTH